MEGALRTSSTSILLFFFFFIFLYFSGSSAMHGSKKLPVEPCNEMMFFFHDILYNGNNAVNATSTIVAAPQGSNLTALAPLNHFGDIVVFDDPLTLDTNLHSPAIGRVQGMYLYDRKDFFTAWLGMTFVFNTTEHQGTISVMGADPALKTRDVSVVGGTGDFIMARGIARIKTDAIEGEVYFRLQIHMKLYDCWY